MRWPPSWLPERVQHWRPTPLQLAGGAAVLGGAFLLLTIASPWSGGSEEDESVSATRTATARPSRSPRTRIPSPTPTETPTPAPTPASTPVPTAAPTRAPTNPPAPPPPAGPPRAALAQLFAWSGSDARLTDLAMFPGSSDEALAITQHEARIWSVSLRGAHPPVPFGDIRSRIGSFGNEEGLFSIAFSPAFGSDRSVYVYYSRGAPQPTVLARYQVVNGVMDSANETVVLEVPDFASNHNGGRIVFGNDGYLYLSTGDGGGAGDPNENGQNINTLLGKVLRLNVTGQQTYSIPLDNPFVGAPGADEIWAYGLRNPWRISKDSATGQIWVGDVGQRAWEEVGPVVRGGNHGWDCYEGFAVFESSDCPASGFVQPRAVYAHSSGQCSVTGGYVYRGSAVPSLSGWYIYGDYCSGEIWAVNPSDASPPVRLQDTPYSISSFAEIPGGELAVVTFDGAVFRLVP
jgi:glucose/arabinose dehydrogenase